MTFLLFLVSVAVLEYILRREPSGERRMEGNPPATRDEPAPDGLRTLAETVERYGSGPTIGTEKNTPAVHKPGGDRV